MTKMPEQKRQSFTNGLLGDGTAHSLQAFQKTAQTGSFSKAARILGLSPSTVAKSIQRLEERINVSLFIRSTRSLSLSQEGRILLEHVSRILDQVSAADHVLGGASTAPAGRVKASIAPGYGRALLLPALAEFRRRFPHVALDLDFASRRVDVVAEGYDVVLRAGAPIPDSGLIGRKLATINLLMCAAPSYVREHGEVTLANLHEQSCIRYRSPASGKIHFWNLADAPKGFSPPETLVFDDPNVVCSSVAEGMGVGVLPDYMAQPLIGQEKLIAIAGIHFKQDSLEEAWLLWPAGRQASVGVRVFIDYLLEKNSAMTA